MFVPPDPWGEKTSVRDFPVMYVRRLGQDTGGYIRGSLTQQALNTPIYLTDRGNMIQAAQAP